MHIKMQIAIMACAAWNAQQNRVSIHCFETVTGRKDAHNVALFAKGLLTE